MIQIILIFIDLYNLLFYNVNINLIFILNCVLKIIYKKYKLLDYNLI